MDNPYQLIVNFLKALDGQLKEQVELYIIGGGSITLCFDKENRTADIDAVEAPEIVLQLAGEDTDLANKHNLYIQKVSDIGFAAPKDWRQKVKLVDLGFKNLKLYIADVHDVVLGKIIRLEPKDLDDIGSLYEKGLVDLNYLLQRLNQNKKELLNIECRNNAKLAFELIFNKKLIFRQGRAILG